MPETAAERGLLDPRDPTSSIRHAAKLLVSLNRRFGNFGLAAAAYNAGPGRLSDWLRGSSVLPAETRVYVELVTGRPVERWLGLRDAVATGRTGRSCASTIAHFRRNAYGAALADGLRGSLPLLILPDGDIVSRKTGQPLSVSDQLAMHQALRRAVRLASEQ